MRTSWHQPTAVCILAAGLGSRMGEQGSVTQKALLPVAARPMLDHIFEQFGEEREYVIAVGPFAEDLRDYCQLAHPNLPITWVQVPRVDEGMADGPGRSLLFCREHLGRPFYLVCSDTLWSEHVTAPTQSNWIGVAPVGTAESRDYCNVQIQEGQAVALADKRPTSTDAEQAFVGLACIVDHATFFEGIEWQPAIGNPLVASREVSLAPGFAALIERKGLAARGVPTWKDTGTLEKYRSAAGTSEFDFGKTGEFFYRIGDRVIKFFAGPEVARHLHSRWLDLQAIAPKDLAFTGRFLSYRFEAGQTLYEERSVERFERLLGWLDDSLWARPASDTKREFSRACRLFYRDKTLGRLRVFYGRHPSEGQRLDPVLGLELPCMDELIASVPWETLDRGVPVPFHGDLHFDNILYSASSGKFTLIDWRTDFGGESLRGDLYYELAKLQLGIEIDLHRIKQGDFEFEDGGSGGVRYRLPAIEGAARYSAILSGFVAKKGLEPERIPLIVALACVNMAALHRGPYDRLIFHEGRRRLAEALGARAGSRTGLRGGLVSRGVAPAAEYL